MKFCLKRVCGSVLLTVASLSATAESVLVNDPYVREPVPGRSMSAAFMTLTNTSDQAQRLVSVSAPWASSIEIHTHLHEDGVMKMRQIESLEVPAGESVTLEPGGLHLMLFGLKTPLKNELPMTFCFDNSECVAHTARLFSPM
jgi:copper(I)-binding protein